MIAGFLEGKQYCEQQLCLIPLFLCWNQSWQGFFIEKVLKKHQEKLNQDFEDRAQKGSFEEEGVFISEEEIVEENDDMESEQYNPCSL